MHLDKWGIPTPVGRRALKRDFGYLFNVLDSDERDKLDLALGDLNLKGFQIEDLTAKLKKVRVITYDRNVGQAGCAYIGHNRLELHEMLFEKGHEQDLKDTFWHEIAHFIDYWLHKGCGHGKTWKRIAKLLGDDGERCHSYAYLKRDYSHYPYVHACKDCGWEMRKPRKVEGWTHRACRLAKKTHGGKLVCVRVEKK